MTEQDASIKGDGSRSSHTQCNHQHSLLHYINKHKLSITVRKTYISIPVHNIHLQSPLHQHGCKLPQQCRPATSTRQQMFLASKAKSSSSQEVRKDPHPPAALEANNPRHRRPRPRHNHSPRRAQASSHLLQRAQQEERRRPDQQD